MRSSILQDDDLNEEEKEDLVEFSDQSNNNDSILEESKDIGIPNDNESEVDCSR